MSERENGYYWVETPTGWEPALWADNDWWITGYDLPWSADDLVSVGERLTPPGKAAYLAGES